MLLRIQQAIEAEAKKRLVKYSSKQHSLHHWRRRFTTRTGQPASIAPHSVPQQWTFHKHFDPRYCLNHSSFLAKGIWASLQEGRYRPTAAYRVSIPKPSGGSRQIDAFSVPDAAIAGIFLNILRTRNANVFSDSSYAYQNNKTPLHAIIHIRSVLNAHKLFVSQYDFSKYFDTIKHAHVHAMIAKDGPFLTTTLERKLLQAVLTHFYIEGSGPTHVREVGIPQGNSLSLFLANVAAHSLDVALGSLNGAFARFADDSVVVNYSNADALRCADAYAEFSQRTGVAINHEKSTGIRILSDRPGELETIDHFDFLGYRFGLAGLCLGPTTIARIKRRCARIIYNHLLLYPKRTNAIGKSRIGRGYRDWDLVTCINELRRYIYGFGRAQAILDAYLNDRINMTMNTGAVSYFCLVEHGAIFRELDGWLLNVLFRAYCARLRLIRSLTRKTYRPLSAQDLCSGEWYKFADVPVETKLPSFYTAWRAARKSWARHGLGGVDAQGAGYSY